MHIFHTLNKHDRINTAACAAYLIYHTLTLSGQIIADGTMIVTSSVMSRYWEVRGGGGVQPRSSTQPLPPPQKKKKKERGRENWIQAQSLTRNSLLVCAIPAASVRWQYMPGFFGLGDWFRLLVSFYTSNPQLMHTSGERERERERGSNDCRISLLHLVGTLNKASGLFYFAFAGSGRVGWRSGRSRSWLRNKWRSLFV